MNDYCVYVMSNKPGGVLYVGMTNDLARRVYEHKHGLVKGFTKKYALNQLVYFEHSTDVNSVIEREKQLKAWRRHWKIELIEKMNPEWNDLYETIVSS